MAKKDKRFDVIYKQGISTVVKILVDKETGVHYLFTQEGYGAGLTVLLDEQGKPVIKKPILHDGEYYYEQK